MPRSLLKLDKKLKDIKIIVSDVDGVLTDGKIFFEANGKELKVFCARDGFRVEVWLRAGKKMVWFTGRRSVGIIRRAKELGVDLIFKADLEGGLFEYLKDKYQVNPKQVLYLGDDWSDLYYMSRSGFSIAPANASAENRELADLVTRARGGEGVLAEVVELVMRAQKIWKKAVGAYQEKFIL